MITLHFSVSNIRREDYKMIFDDSKAYVDILQCNNAPSTRTPRGHQFPAAFMHHVSDTRPTKIAKSNYIGYYFILQYCWKICMQFVLGFWTRQEYGVFRPPPEVFPFGYCWVFWRFASPNYWFCRYSFGYAIYCKIVNLKKKLSHLAISKFL